VCYTETPLDYIPVEVFIGDMTSLLCNTSLSSDMMWTYDDTDDIGYVDYVYWNGHIDNDTPRLSMTTSRRHSHSLVIYPVQLSDNGLYDCYSSDGLRTIGYRLQVHSTTTGTEKSCTGISHNK